MAKPRTAPLHRSTLGVSLGMLALGCGLGGENTRLSKTEEEDDGASIIFSAPAETGPKLGAIANATPVLERPFKNSRALGLLHAGAFVARSGEPVRKTPACDGGYYPVFPRGVVCLNQGATLDLAHPTLQAMAQKPALDAALPYAYGRARVETALLERDPKRPDAVRELSKLPRGSSMAIVGSWSAHLGDDGEKTRLGLLTNGRFVRAEDLEAVRGSTFSGYELDDEHKLPVAFVVKRGVSAFKPEEERFSKLGPLEYHEVVPLSGKFRTVAGTRMWASSAERWVRDQDVTLIQRRTKFPDFVRDGQRWLDVGVILGTLVAYEGTRAVFATLVSTGRDRFAETPTLPGIAPAVTKLGTFEVIAKHITLLGGTAERAGERVALFDLPWVLELSSGQSLQGAYWHDRFGIEHGAGDVLLAPADARRIFEWSTPALPKAWHSITDAGKDKTFVVVHK